MDEVVGAGADEDGSTADELAGAEDDSGALDTGAVVGATEVTTGALVVVGGGAGSVVVVT